MNEETGWKDLRNLPCANSGLVNSQNSIQLYLVLKSEPLPLTIPMLSLGKIIEILFASIMNKCHFLFISIDTQKHLSAKFLDIEGQQ